MGLRYDFPSQHSQDSPLLRITQLLNASEFPDTEGLAICVCKIQLHHASTYVIHSAVVKQ